MSPEARSAVPEPRVEEDEAPMLDEVIERIDQTLPTIIQRASPPPGKKQKVRITKKARSVFIAMSKDPLLTESGDDIREATPRNGTLPE